MRRAVTMSDHLTDRLISPPALCPTGAVMTDGTGVASGADAAGDVLAEHLGAGPDHVRVEARRQGGQGGVQVKGQVSVGAGGPAVVGRAAGGQGGAADG